MADRTCPQCGTVAAEKLKFCRECGARLEDSMDGSGPAPADPGDATIMSGGALRPHAALPPAASSDMDDERTFVGDMGDRPPAPAPPPRGTGTQTFMGGAPLEEEPGPPEDPGDRTIMAGLPLPGSRPAASPPPPPPPPEQEASTATFIGTYVPGQGVQMPAPPARAPLPPPPPAPPPPATPPPPRPPSPPVDAGEDEPVSQDIDLEEDRSGSTLAAPGPAVPPPPPPPPAARGTALRLEHWAPGVKTEVLSFDRQETVVGRDRGDVRYPEDAYLSRKHARFYRDPEGRPMLEDLGTLNGTFLRIRAPVKLEHRDIISLGRHTFRFELLKFEEKDDRTIEGDPLTRVQGVQGTAPRARIVKRQEEGFSGTPFFFGSSRYVLGRNEGTHIFQKDDRMSRRHAELAFKEGEFWLEDLGSQNGTFLRLLGPHVLLQGDVLRLGDQYLKVL